MRHCFKRSNHKTHTGVFSEINGGGKTIECHLYEPRKPLPTKNYTPIMSIHK